MKIYITHSTSFNYRSELYIPLRNSSFNSRHDIFLPHETETIVNSKEIIKKANLVIGEVSFPSTGEGIELGWASSFEIPIICFYKEGTRPSTSLAILTKKIISYKDSSDLLSKIESSL